MNETILVMNQVQVHFPDREEPILKDFSLSLHKGEWVGIAGRNGCGKSMLGKLIAGLEGYSEGSMERTGRYRTGWVMQNPEAQLVGEYVWDDVVFGLENLGMDPKRIHEEAAAALQQVGLFKWKNKPVHQLSGGQKQLLALAGIIAMRPSLLVADEVTSMLDPASRHRIMQVLHLLHKQGMAIVMITQILDELAMVDRIIALEQGCLVYDGAKEGFFYEGVKGEDAVCERLGLQPPHTVQVVKELQRRGHSIPGFPLTPETLREAVGI